MTEEERAERLRRLQERRSASGAAPRPKSLEDTQPIEVDRTATLRSERPSTAETHETHETTFPGWSSRPQSDGAARAPRKPRKSHKAEASRIASAGAGIALTFTLMSAMAGADGPSAVTTAPAGPGGAVPPETAVTPTLGSVSSTIPVASIVAATPQGPVPVILTPVQVRTRVIRAAGGSSGGSSGGASGGSSGGASGGSSGVGVQAPTPPPPPPPPAPTTQSNGSG